MNATAGVRKREQQGPQNTRPQLKFLGGVGTVTGSKYLLKTGGQTILIDCGLFQGYKQLRLRNWAPFPVDPRSIDTVVITHAHLDHSGYLPLLVKSGFSGPILSTSATRDLCEILLKDSGHLQEREAEFANRHKFSKHHPALPLYTQQDAERSLQRFLPVDFGRDFPLSDDLTLKFRRAGHILGAATVELRTAGTVLVFSGDLGRFNDKIMLDPEPVTIADYLVVESTYGNRRHDTHDPQAILSEIIDRTVKRGGTILVPSFAVGRAQTLLYHLYQLRQCGRISRTVPIFLDSPMAIDASKTFCDHPNDLRLTAEQCRSVCSHAHYIQDVEESKSVGDNPKPKVLISASGMATGGRVLHHLKRLASDPRNTILFAGFQAGGTRGASIVGGAESVKIHGQQVPIRADVYNLEMLSAHADADEILRWLGGFEAPPRMTFITHGEPVASDALRTKIQENLGWPCQVPEHLQETEL